MHFFILLFLILYQINNYCLASTNSHESPISSPMKRLQTSESMKELQRTYSPVGKQNGSTSDLLSQTNSLDGMHFVNYFIKLTN